MALPKIITIYKALSSREQELFADFVRSPYNNKRKKILLLLDIIENAFKTGATGSWDKSATHQLIFGVKETDEFQINNLLSDLYKLLEKYLAWKQFEKHQDRKDVLVIENLMQTAITENAGKIIKRKTQQEESTDAVSNFKLYQLADQYYFQLSRKGNNTHLIKSQEALDIYYLSNQLKIWCELMNRSNILALQYDNIKFERFIQFLENNLSDYAHYPTVSIYYPILLWLKNPDSDGWYEGFREKLFLHIKEFPESEAKDIVAYIQNYCVKRINQGRNEFLQEWFEIAQFMLPLDLLNDNKYISEWTYKNIITVGVRLHAFEWTENFIHGYYSKLAPEQRDNAYQYNLAVYYYEKQDFDKAMQLLNRVHFTDPNYYLDAKSILLKIFYDHQEFEALLSLKDTVKIYLLRDKQLSKSQRALYKNLFNNTIKLYKLRINKGIVNAEKWGKLFTALRQEVDSTTILANKQWLQLKIAEITDMR